MSKRIIEIELISDVSKLKTGFAEADASADKLGKSTETMGGHVSKLGALAKGAALGGVALFGEGLHKSIDAAKENEVTQAKLAASVNDAGLSFGKYKGEIDETIAKQSELSGFTRNELSESFANMVRTTGNVSAGLKLNATAMDLARTKGMNLTGATSLLARVYNGNYNGLKKLGIAYTPVTTAQDALKASTDHATDAQIAAAKAADATANRQGALAVIQQKFGGQAEAYGKTTAGAQDRFKVATEELEVSVGKGLLPVLTTLSTDAANVVEWFQKNKTAAEALGVGVGALGVAIVGLKIANFASDIGKVVTAVRDWTVVQTALDAVMDANPVVLVTAAVVALAAGVYEAYQHSATFRQGANDLFDALRIGAAGPVLLVEKAFDAVSGVLSTLLHGLSHIPGFGWADTAADKIDKARDATRDLVDKIAGIPTHKSVSVDISANIPQSLTDLIINNPSGSQLTKVKPRAGGGYVNEALTLVGEQGPELVSLPRGSYVHTAAASRRMAQGGSSSAAPAAGQVINVAFNGPVGSQQAAKVLALQLAHGLRFG